MPLSRLFSLLLLLLLLLSLSPPTSSASSDLFEQWCAEHGKRYASEEEKLARFKVFEDNLAFIQEHNAKGDYGYTLGLNAFADLTHHEFRSARLGLAAGRLELPRANRSVFLGSDRAVPDSIDWREKGAVTHVKDQGTCGMMIDQIQI